MKARLTGEYLDPYCWIYTDGHTEGELALRLTLMFEAIVIGIGGETRSSR